MKKMRLIGLMIMMVLVMCVGTALAEPAQTATPSKMTVEGSATVMAKPDVASVNLGVQTESEEAKEAQTENAALMNAVLAAVKELGIADADVQTAGFNVNPKYNYETQMTTGYIVTNSVVVTLKDLDKVSAVIDAAVAAGVNNTSISFSIADPTPVYQQALRNALRNANGKAAALAEVMGTTVGMPVEVTEQSSYRPYANSRYYAEAAASAGDGTPIQSGEIEVSATVLAVYEYSAEGDSYTVD